MAKRTLYLAAYDVTQPSRLRRIHYVIKGYASGGQKSVFECFLTAQERTSLLRDVSDNLDESTDRFALLRVEERTQPILYGIAIPAADPDFYYVG